MSTYQDMVFHLGEDWMVDFSCVDADGDAIDIGSSTIRWRLATVSGTTVMTLTEADGITITSGTGGLCSLRVTGAHQTSASVAAATRYQWELRVTTSGGLVTVQARGHLNVLPSLLAA